MLALIAFNVIAALSPTTGKFVGESNLGDDFRKPGSLQRPSVSLVKPAEFFGLNKNRLFGFTKENEIFVGRMAQLCVCRRPRARGPMRTLVLWADQSA